MAVFGQVDGAQIELAGFAGFHANVGKLLGYIDGEFLFVVFAAGGAENAAKLPLLKTKRTSEKAFAAVGFGAEHSEQRQRATARTDPRVGGELRRGHAHGEKFGIGLEKRAKDEFGERFGLVVIFSVVGDTFRLATRTPEIGEGSFPL